MNRDKANVLYCPHCGSTKIWEHTYVNVNTGEKDESFLSENLQQYDYLICQCCNNGELTFSDLKTIEQLWEDFEDVPFLPDDTLDEDFLGFEAGEATKLDIWEWFAERWPEDVPNPCLKPLMQTNNQLK